MPLRAKKPTTVRTRLKALFYGVYGCGKTTASINFPAPYFIDTEGGSEQPQYLETLEKNGGVIFQTVDFNELLTEIKSLMTEEHSYKTLIVDPITPIYHYLLQENEALHGTEYAKHYVETRKQFRGLMHLLTRLDMNVIFTAHVRQDFDSREDIPDCEKRLPYLFDLILQLQSQPNGNIAYVKKSRLQAIEQHSSFEFSYKKLESLCPTLQLDKTSTPENLATTEQIQELKHLFSVLHIDPIVIEKGLEKANSPALEFLAEDKTVLWIDSLKRRLNNELPTLN